MFNIRGQRARGVRDTTFLSTPIDRLIILRLQVNTNWNDCLTYDRYAVIQLWANQFLEDYRRDSNCLVIIQIGGRNPIRENEVILLWFLNKRRIKRFCY